MTASLYQSGSVSSMASWPANGAEVIEESRGREGKVESAFLQVLIEDLDGRVLLPFLGSEHAQGAAALFQERDQLLQGPDLNEPRVLAGPCRGLRPADRPRPGRLLRHAPLGSTADLKIHRQPPF